MGLDVFAQVLEQGLDWVLRDERKTVAARTCVDTGDKAELFTSRGHVHLHWATGGLIVLAQVPVRLPGKVLA